MNIRSFYINCVTGEVGGIHILLIKKREKNLFLKTQKKKNLFVKTKKKKNIFVETKKIS